MAESVTEERLREIENLRGSGTGTDWLSAEERRGMCTPELITEIRTLRVKLAAAEVRERRLREVLSKFAGYGAFVKAYSELTGYNLKPETCITSMQGGGGSDYLWWSDFEKAITALAQPPKEAQMDGGCNSIQDTELLTWLDSKDRSAHQDGTRWSIWLNTSNDNEPITVEGDLRTALRIARDLEANGG